jgi:hypothetical protein
MAKIADVATDADGAETHLNIRRRSIRDIEATLATFPDDHPLKAGGGDVINEVEKAVLAVDALLSARKKAAAEKKNQDEQAEEV